MINSAPELKELAKRACDAPRIALDTEFLWERTFFPQLGVVQIGFSEQECYLVDAIALPGLPGLGDVLASSNTEKILHDAQQDLTILARITGVAPVSIFDTRCAAGFCGTRSTASLLTLLRDFLKVEIPKSEQRSNWLRRPLTHKQAAYALNDVRFLPSLRDALSNQAEQFGNLNFLQQEMKRFNDPILYESPTPENLFMRMKTGRLRPASRPILLELIRWREKEARSRNIPRAHVMRDKDLITLARHMPETTEQLSHIQELPHSASRRYAKSILESITVGRHCDPPRLPSPRDQRLTTRQKQKLSKRIERMHAAANKAYIDPALVASKADMVEIIAAEDDESKPTPRCQKGWRKHFVN